MRNHGGIRDIDKDKCELSLDGLVQQPKSYTPNELIDKRMFSRLEGTVTIKWSESHLLGQASGDGHSQGPPVERADMSVQA